MMDKNNQNKKDSCNNQGSKVQSNRGGLEDEHWDIGEPEKEKRQSDDSVPAKKRQCNSLASTKLVSFLLR